MQGIKHLCAGKYSANQVGNTIYVIAFGQHPNNRYEVELEDTPIAVFPPPFRLMHRELGGKVVEVITKFAVYTDFSSEDRIENVTVYDADGEHQIYVEQTPDFQIDPEIKRLLGEKDIDYEKLSAGLSSLVQEYDEIGISGAGANSSGLSMTPLLVPSSGGTPETIIFIRCDDEAHIDLPGVNINSQKGTIRTAKVSLDGLDGLSRQHDVYRLSSSVKLKPLIDEAARKTQLNNFRISNNQNLTGKGVIIGIIDTGIDSSHQCFAGRILSIWDQKIEGQGWGEKDYGTVLTGALLAASCDTSGHGTHVAGIAAGNDAKFGGVAPEADLIVVKTDFNNAHIVDGIEYIFAEADRLGKPAVINLSLGGHVNAHDGTDDLSEFIDTKSREGRVVVVAAGNEAAVDIHGGAEIAPGETAEIKFKVSRTNAGQTPPIVLFSGWYEADGSCEIGVRAPDGHATEFQEVINDKKACRHYLLENTLVSLATPSTSATSNGDHTFRLKLLSNLIPIPQGNWHIVIRNKGNTNVKVDIWSSVPDNFDDVEFVAPFIRNDLKIGSPGSASKAITVASYTTRNEWHVGAFTFSPTFTVDDISDSSSPGPTRNINNLKPDIAAPGEWIVSALSKHVKQSNLSKNLLMGDDFKLNSGTSMACPFITGLCALLLEQNPSLTAGDIKQFLRSKGQIRQQPAVNHDPKWGFGLVKF